MERNYFEQPAHPYKTPRAVALNVPEQNLSIHVWVCSPHNTLDEATWFYGVEVRHADERIEWHYFGSYPEAMRYRFHRADVAEPKMIVEIPQGIEAFLNNERLERGIAKVDFGNVPLWDGYTYQEIINIRS